ncbi:MAG: UDP-N-acetylmuramoyl-L-alanyl-D-glutamate--2,6-diaminopimelate ligase, partial [Clostridia bacterium]|nr:UDP-N-acetylmuramoyl-L-alanyl-D-glutamate--2,6-diaminopimelate ligase [Clostridia bacterium]
MKLYELLENLNENYAHLKDLEVGKVTCDSRAVDEGDVFVCINGVSVDGHKFTDKAVEHGAAVIVCERDLGLENQIIVENTRKEYALMCSKYFGEPSKKIKLIGVTGTNGKTSTCMILKHILESNGHKVGLIGTVQNMVGDSVLPAKNTTPDAFELHSLFFLMVMAGCDYVVMEVSS